MAEYTVLGGHENMEFRYYSDDQIEVYSTEHDECVGVMTRREVQELSTFLIEIEGEDERHVPPTFDEVMFRQHVVTGGLMIIDNDVSPKEWADRSVIFANVAPIHTAAERLKDGDV